VNGSCQGISGAGGSGSGNGTAGSAAVDPGDTQPGGQFNGCVQQFYDPNNHGWLTYKNGCAVVVNVTFACQAPDCNGAMSLAPGRQDATGYTQAEIDGYGGVQTAVCADGYAPVDQTGAYWTYGSQFVCKKQ
jgi:hypothetical protein